MYEDVIVCFSAGATIRGTRRLPMAVSQRGRQKGQKYNYVVEKVTNIHQEKVMNMMKMSETHVHAIYEKKLSTKFKPAQIQQVH